MAIYKDTKALAGWRRGFAWTGLAIGLLVCGVAAMALFFGLQGADIAQGWMGGAYAALLLSVAVNLIAQIPFVLWLRRLSLNGGRSSLRAIIACLVPVINLWWPYTILKKVGPYRLRGLSQWWVAKQMASLPALCIVFVGMAVVIRAFAPPDLIPPLAACVPAYAGIVSLIRDYLGWRVGDALTQAVHREHSAQVAVNAF